LFGQAAPYILWGVGFLTAGITAFYMTRLMAMTFEGKERFLHATAHDGGTHEPEPEAEPKGSHGGHGGHGVATAHAHEPHTPHESPSVMTIPLIILAGLAAIGGFMGVPGYSLIERWLEPVIDKVKVPGVEAAAHGFGTTEIVLAVVSVLWAAGAI